MKPLNLLGATLGLACIIALGGFVASVGVLHHQQIEVASHG